MAKIMSYISSFLVTILLVLAIVLCDDKLPIPEDKAQLDSWFSQNVVPLSSRKNSLDNALVAAEANTKIIKVAANGRGDFTTITDAIKSVPTGNKNRVVISIGPGTYKEKVRIDRDKPFITFYGDANNMPTLIYDGTALEYGTMDSATLIVESDYFVGVNLKVVNSAQRPDMIRKGAQASAFRIGGDKAAFYNCRFHGFQDTLCDDKGRHFFKDCYIEGTVDFIFGDGKSIYLNTETHVIPGDQEAMITAQARKSNEEVENLGFSFVHCNVTGTGGIAYLGRAWMAYARVVFAYSDLSQVVRHEGWSLMDNASHAETVYFGEYNNKGPGSDLSTRASFVKKLTDADAKPFISLGFVEGSKWLLPPPKY